MDILEKQEICRSPYAAFTVIDRKNLGWPLASPKNNITAGKLISSPCWQILSDLL